MVNSLIGTGRFVEPSTVATHFHIREGDVVADFGAGAGYYVEIFARLVGGDGKVYACEVQKELVEKIGVLARSKGLHMVNPLWCDIETKGGVKISDGSVDVAVMINTFFQLEEKYVTLSEVGRILRSGAKFFVIDWTDSFGGLGPAPDQIISAQETQAMAESSGFVFERTFDAGDHHYGLAFRKI